MGFWEDYKKMVSDYYRPIAEVPKEKDRDRVVGEAIAWLDSLEPNELHVDFYTRMMGGEHRKGFSELMDWLSRTDFWVAPASTRFHECEAGGLVRHSLRVHDALVELHDFLAMTYQDDFDRDYTRETLALVALCHDLCKVRYYAPAGKWRKDDGGRWYIKTEWTVHDQYPLGHGERSMYLLQNVGVKLSPEEATAIRWHTGAFEPGVVHGYPTGFAFNDARRKGRWPLVLLLHMADQVAQHREEVAAKED